MRSRASSRRWAVSSASASGRTRTSISTDVLADHGVRGRAAHRRRRGAAAFPGVRARAGQGEHGARPGDSEEHAAVGGRGEVLGADVRRPSVRPDLSDRGDAHGLHARPGAGFSSRSTSLPAARGSISPASSTPRRWRRASGRRSTRWPRGAAVAAPPKPAPRDRRLRPGRSRGRAAIDGDARAQGRRSVARRLGGARGHRLAPRRLVRLAHHGQHPRAEGLHLLALQRARLASRRRPLVRGART